MRFALALFALLCAACADTVVLGTECVTGGGTCSQIKPGPGGEGVDAGNPPSEVIDGGEDPPSASLDSGSDQQPPVEPTRDTGARGPRDASVFPIRDAARPPPVPADAGPANFPMFFNPSFELIDGGREGEVGMFNPGGQAPGESPIAPWQICRGGTTVVSSATYGLPPRMITPKDGNTFITDTIPLVAFNPNGVNQELMEPLVTGKRYGFVVDVFAQFDLLLNLRDLVLEVSAPDAAGCTGRTLAYSAPIPPGSWQTRCLDFIATESTSPLLPRGPIRSLMLMAQAPGDFVNVIAALHIDNIRPYSPALCESDAGAP